MMRDISSDFRVIGEGNLGEKARQLVKKTPGLKDIGFQVPHRTILAEGFFDGFFQRNGLGIKITETAADDSIASKIVRGNISADDYVTIQNISAGYSSTPVMVRSSAEGDARGTGTYQSVLAENTPGTVRKGLQRVLASYFSPSAIDFRRDAQTGDGFGVVIEPVVGQMLTKTYEYAGSTYEFYAPILSGYGYTSTLKGEGYINVVPGLGGGVDNKDGLRIGKTEIEEVNGDLRSHLISKRDSERWHDPWERDRPQLLRHEIQGKAYNHPTKYQPRGSSYNQDMDLRKNKEFQKLNMLPFFEMIGQMETAFGAPQYFEWAMTVKDSAAKYWLLQIADVNKKADHMEFVDYGEVLLMAHTVTGAGIKDITKVVNCWNIEDIEGLNKFNQHNTDYALLYSSRLTTSMGRGFMRKLEYADFSNATVFLEIQDSQHLGSPVSHLGGQLDVTGKLFGVVDYEAEVPPNWKELHDGEKKEDGIKVYPGKFKVVASEKQDKMLVYKQPGE